MRTRVAAGTGFCYLEFGRHAGILGEAPTGVRLAEDTAAVSVTMR